MRINYYLPFATHTGGVMAVFEHVKALVERGHDATVTVPNTQLPIRWASPEHVVGIGHPTEMPDADVLVATASKSVELVSVLPPSTGEKFYFVQGYESLWCGNVDWTYKLPMKKIVVSSWLQRVMAESFDEKSFVVNPGLDHETYRPGSGSGGNGRRVLVMDHATRVIKGTWVAIQAVELARRSIPDLELVVFGMELQDEGLGRVAERHTHPLGSELAELYASCDVFLYPVIADGFGLPPLEAMACGTAVVTTDHTGTSDWASPDACYVVPAHDVAATADAVVRALQDPDERNRIAEGGRRKAAEFTWEKAGERLEAAFTGGW